MFSLWLMLAKRSKVRSRVCFLEEDRWRLVARAKSHQVEHLAQGVGCEAGLEEDALLVGHVARQADHDVPTFGLAARRQIVSSENESFSLRENISALHEIRVRFL